MVPPPHSIFQVRNNMAGRRIAIDKYITPPKSRALSPSFNKPAADGGARTPIPVSRLGTPVSVTDDDDLDDLENFDWSLIDTEKRFVRIVEREPEASVIAECNDKLAALSDASDNPDGLKALIDGTNAILEQKWTTFVLFFDHFPNFPRHQKWSKIEWRRCDVVEFFTRICCDYRTIFEAHGEYLEAEYIDREYVSLVNDICALGMEVVGDSIEIKDWESDGTKTAMEIDGLHVECEPEPEVYEDSSDESESEDE